MTIAGYTYGALLGAFLLGRLVKRANQVDAVIAFLVTVAVMTYIVRYVKIDGRPGNHHRHRRAVAGPDRRPDHPGRRRGVEPVPRAPEPVELPDADEAVVRQAA